MSGTFQNIDLFSVGVAVASTGILGFVVFLNNRKSITNKTFLAFSVVTVIWGIANYLHYQTRNPIFALWSLRAVFFFAVWISFTIFQLFYVFPSEKIEFSKKYKFILLPIVFLTALITLTPLVSSEVTGFSPEGVPENTKGPGIVIFGLVSIGLVIGSLYLLFRKIRRGTDVERKQLKIMLIGTLLMFGLIIPLNFILPAFFEKFTFLPLSAVFTLPFVALTGYAISKYRLFDVKVVATEILTFVLATVTLFEVLIAQDVLTLSFRIGVFALVLIFGILLIRSIRREVEQREKLEVLSKELAAANEGLKKLDRAKSEFISLAGHQLRAPLTSIKGFSSLVIEGTYGAVTEKARAALGKVMFSTEQLVKLIDSLLDLSRIESGKISYDFKPGNLTTIIEEVIGTLSPKAADKHATVTFDNKVKEPPAFSFDHDKLREVIVNLVDNAIKYSEEGKVEVKQELIGAGNKQSIRVSVKDAGLGIKKEDIPRLFEKFMRTEIAKSVDVNGLGLGLYFVKRVAEDHGGSVGAESDGIGKGSTFLVELPIAG